MRLDHTDGCISGQTPIPVKTTSRAWRRPAAAPREDMFHRHLLIITIQRIFLIIIGFLIHNRESDSRGDPHASTFCQRGPNSCRAARPRDEISHAASVAAPTSTAEQERRSSDVSRTDGTASSSNRPPANRRDRAGSTPRLRLWNNGSSKAAGAPLRARSCPASRGQTGGTPAARAIAALLPTAARGLRVPATATATAPSQ